MKTKREMAHEYALEMLKRGDLEWRIVTDAWNLADSMHLENAERENNVSQGLVKEEWQPDWSQAPFQDISEWYKKENGQYEWAGYNQYGKFTANAPSFGYTGNWKDSLRERT